MARSYTLKDYLLNPNADPLRGITALSGRYNTSNFISGVDASVRASFSLATSIIRGTFKFANGVSKTLNSLTSNSVRNNTQYRNLHGTLIGTEAVDNFINLTDEVRAESTESYRAVSNFIARNTINSFDSDSGQAGVERQNPQTELSAALARIKGVAAALSKFNFGMPDIIRDALVIDIETGGLNKDAPILQLAMVDMANIEAVSELLPTREMDPEQAAERLAVINRMTPEEQMRQGFLNLNMMPTALIRDTSQVDSAGRPRRPTYRSTSNTIASMDEFREQYGSWAVGDRSRGVEARFQHLEAFYNEYGDENGVISPQRMAEIERELENRGFILLQDGQRIYSQREAAKQSMIYSRRAGELNRMLIAANMPFESFRVGKLWEYFIRNRPEPGQAANRSFDVAAFPADVHHLNQDPDMIEAFGHEIQGLDDFRRSMFAATWQSHYKRNILDPNNYVYQRDFEELRDTGRLQEAITLFPSWTQNVSQGLQTRDQLDLTRMVYSGLMRTGYIEPTGDIFSGTKIDFATRALFGEIESHEGLQDAIHQGRILTEGKLFEVTNDLFNIVNAREGEGSVLNHFKALTSATSMLANPMKRGWMALGRYLKDYRVDMTDQFIGLDNNQYRPLEDWGVGSIADLQRNHNTDREVLRIAETADYFTGQDPNNNLFRLTTIRENETVLVADERGHLTPELDANGQQIFDTNPHTGEQIPRFRTQVLNVEAPAYEPFNVGRPVGRMRQEKVTSDGRSLSFFRRTQSYELETEMREMYAALRRQGVPEAQARDQIRRVLFERLAETESYSSRGVTADMLEQRFNQMDSALGGAVGRRQVLRARLDSSDRNFFEEVMRRSAGEFQRIRADIVQNRYGIDIGSLGRGLRALTPEISAVDYTPRGTGQDTAVSAFQGVRDLFRIGNDVRRAVMSTPLQAGTMTSMGERFIAGAFTRENIADLGTEGLQASLADARWFLENAARPLVAFGGLAAVGAAAATGYLVDGPEWKKSSASILKMTGNERKILSEGHYKKSSLNIKEFTTPYAAGIQHTNDLGVSLSAIQSSNVDFAVGDADTIQVLTKGFMGMGRRSLGSVRVSGIDAPETAHEGGTGPGAMPYAQQGRQYLTNVLSAKTGATIAIGGRQTFGRSVGLITDMNGTNFSYRMIEQGIGSVLFREKAEEDLVNQKEYMSAEHKARKSEAGMWADPFYSGAQAGIGGKERKGWNVLSPLTAKRFNFKEGPGTSEEQMQTMNNNLQMLDNYSKDQPIPNDLISNNNGMTEEAYNRKLMMAEMQQGALRKTMQRNRGRAKERR
jgi:endonuclease YncB( thermonuclease family)